MIILSQRVSSANVVVDNQIVANIDKGILALVCVEETDDDVIFARMIEKILKYRIFEDTDNKMNLSLKDINASIILVPQFTLTVDTSKGTRPSFSKGCPPNIAKIKFANFVKMFSNTYKNTQSGIFGANMQVSLTNDGPVTFNFRM